MSNDEMSYVGMGLDESTSTSYVISPPPGRDRTRNRVRQNPLGLKRLPVKDHYAGQGIDHEEPVTRQSVARQVKQQRDGPVMVTKLPKSPLFSEAEEKKPSEVKLSKRHSAVQLPCTPVRSAFYEHTDGCLNTASLRRRGRVVSNYAYRAQGESPTPPSSPSSSLSSAEGSDSDDSRSTSSDSTLSGTHIPMIPRRTSQIPQLLTKRSRVSNTVPKRVPDSTMPLPILRKVVAGLPTPKSSINNSNTCASRAPKKEPKVKVLPPIQSKRRVAPVTDSDRERPGLANVHNMREVDAIRQRKTNQATPFSEVTKRVSLAQRNTQSRR